jgi:hypothetical protein
LNAGNEKGKIDWLQRRSGKIINEADDEKCTLMRNWTDFGAEKQFWRQHGRKFREKVVWRLYIDHEHVHIHRKGYK